MTDKHPHLHIGAFDKCQNLQRRQHQPVFQRARIFPNGQNARFEPDTDFRVVCAHWMVPGLAQWARVDKWDPMIFLHLDSLDVVALVCL